MLFDVTSSWVCIPSRHLFKRVTAISRMSDRRVPAPSVGIQRSAIICWRLAVDVSYDDNLRPSGKDIASSLVWAWSW